MRLKDGYIIHFRSRLFRAVTISRTITRKVKLAPVVRKPDTYEFTLDGEPEWFELEEVEKHARFVGAFSGKEAS